MSEENPIKTLTRRFLFIDSAYWPTPHCLKIRHKLSGEVAYLENNIPPLKVTRKCGEREQIEHFQTVEAFLKYWRAAP